MHVPDKHIQKVGGYTITSTPADAEKEHYIELAIQATQTDPVGKWLWKPNKYLINEEVRIRIGGSFVWPPHGIDESEIKGLKVVMIAGGVGIKYVSLLSSHLTYHTNQIPFYWNENTELSLLKTWIAQNHTAHASRHAFHP